jgi:hypothetical protein
VVLFFFLYELFHENATILEPRDQLFGFEGFLKLILEQLVSVFNSFLTRSELFLQKLSQVSINDLLQLLHTG